MDGLVSHCHERLKITKRVKVVEKNEGNIEMKGRNDSHWMTFLSLDVS